MKKNSMIIERIIEERQGKNQTVGVFVGKLEGGRIMAGWSRCRLDLGDKFDMKTAINNAIQNGLWNKQPVYRGSLISVCDKFETFRNRCLRYFKGFDFDGRTTVNYSKAIEANKRNGVKQEKTVSELPESPMATFVRNQLKGVGIDSKKIDDFIKYGLPIAEELSSMGVQGLALPISGDYSQAGMSKAMSQMAMSILTNPPMAHDSGKTSRDAFEDFVNAAEKVSGQSQAKSNFNPNANKASKHNFRDNLGRFSKLPF